MMRSTGLMRVALVAAFLALSTANIPWCAADEQPPAAPADQTQPPAAENNQNPATKPAKAAKEPTSKPARTSRRPNRKPAAIKVPASFNADAQQLRREFEQGKLRTKSNYFTEHLNADLTPDVVMALLQKKLDKSPALDAYVKWQLLSALPAELPEQYIGDLLALYRSAPQPEIRPGLSPDQKKRLDNEVRHVNDPRIIVDRLNDEVRQVAELNASIFGFRDALMARMPDTYDGLQAALEDVFIRAQAGADTNEAANTISRRIQKWSADASPRDINDMVALLKRVEKQELPKYYFDASPKREEGAFPWQERSSNIGDIAHIIGFIQHNVAAPDPGPANPKRTPRDNSKKKNAE